MADNQELINFLKLLNTEQGAADWTKYLNTQGMLTTGEPTGNPGYSLAAPTYSTQHYNAGTGKVTGGYNDGPVTQAGAVWVGAPGGDTEDNRGLFEDYLTNNTIFGSNNPGSKPNYLTASTQSAGQTQSNPYTPEVQEYLKALNAANQTTAAPAATTGYQYTPADIEFLKAASQLNPSAGTVHPVQAINQFRNVPEGATQEERDWIANEFYAAMRTNPDAVKQLTPQEQMQYAWLQYEKGLISGNQKDDRIKAIRKEYDMPKEVIGDGKNGEGGYNNDRSIVRNKIDQAGKKDGLTSGDVFQIGGYTQSDTGKDKGMMEQFINKSAPGFDLQDFLDVPGVGAVAAIASPFTGGVTGGVYSALATSGGRMDLDEAIAYNLLANSAQLGAGLSANTGLMTPIVGQGAVVTGAGLVQGDSLKDSVIDGVTTMGLSTAGNIMELEASGYGYGTEDVKNIFDDVLPDSFAKIAAEATMGVIDAGKGAAGAVNNLLTPVSDAIDYARDYGTALINDIDMYLSGGKGSLSSTFGFLSHEAPLPDWLSEAYEAAKGAVKVLADLGDNVSDPIKQAIVDGTMAVLDGVQQVITHKAEVPGQTASGAPLGENQFSNNMGGFLTGDWAFMDDLPYKPREQGTTGNTGQTPTEETPPNEGGGVYIPPGDFGGDPEEPGSGPVTEPGGDPGEPGGDPTEPGGDPTEPGGGVYDPDDPFDPNDPGPGEPPDDWDDPDDPADGEDPEDPDEPDDPEDPGTPTIPGGIGAGLLAVGSKGDWEDYYSGINVRFPLLEKLGITPSQYLQLLMARAK